MPCSVVIPCHNGVDLTGPCIRSMLDQRPAPIEIVIVDNASTDGTADLDQLDPRVRVIRLSENRGFAGGINAGLAAVDKQADEVLILNNDTIAETNMLAEMRRALYSPTDIEIGACGPVSNRVKEDARLPVGDLSRDPEERRAIAAALADDPIVQDVESLSGLCMLIRCSTLERVGNFDELFGLGNFEDDDFSLRLRLLGLRLVIARRAFLHHEGHQTFHALGLDMREQIQLRLTDFDAKWQQHPAGRAVVAAIHSDLPGAAVAAKAALAVAPDWLDAEWHLGRFEEQFGNPHHAIQYLRSFLTRCPEHVRALISMGLATLRTGDTDGGLQMLADVTNRHRLSPAAQHHTMLRLGEIDYDAGKHEQARAHFEAAIAINPDAPNACNGIGLTHLALEDYEAAERSFEAAIEHGHALAYTNLGICQMMRGNHEDALANFERAVVLLPQNQVARDNYEAGRIAVARATEPAS